jgi:hypothetical protein
MCFSLVPSVSLGTFSYRRNRFLGGIKSVAESIPPEESMPRSRLKVTINFNTPLILSPLSQSTQRKKFFERGR